MRRPLVALLIAAVGVVSLAPSAEAGGTTDIVVGAADGSFVVRSVPTGTVGSALARAERDPDVAWAEVDATFSATAVTPGDPLYPDQWGPVKVRAPEAWERTTGDTSVVVAVVDTGVDATHPDLVGAVLQGADFVNDGKSGDPSGHGTGVAGVVAAHGNNALGIAGYCWSCKVLPVRVLDANGDGSSSGIAAGVNWAATHGADIINLSLAGPRSSTTLDVAIANARQRGIIVVAAAGNRTSATQNLTLPQYPAATTGVIGVVGTDIGDAPYTWTFRGGWADLAAPGCVVTTTTGGGYAEQCGTSFASPAVAGILGLALGGFPGAPLTTIESELLASAVPVGSTIAERGRVDAGAYIGRLAAAFPNVVVPERIAGANRIATAVALSKRAFNAADTVVIARADSYADALAAAPLAGRFGAPVLLTTSGSLASEVATEVKRLGATTAWLIGGEGALAPAVDAGLAAAGATQRPRLAGASRYETARLIAEQLGAASVYVTQAGGWPDAVAVSGLAALTKTPILLVDATGVPASTAQALTKLRPTTITVFGGPSVVAESVLTQLRAYAGTVTRVSGATRYETSRAIATIAVASGAEAIRTWVATGADWPDALAAGPAAAAERAVLLLVDGRNASGTPTATAWLQGVAGGVRELVIVGGEASVSAPAAAMLAAAIS